MLLLEHALGDREMCVVVEHRDARLGDDLSLVKLLVDEVHGGAGEANARGENSLVNVLAVHALPPERREKRRVDVHHAPLVRSTQLGRYQPQVSRE